jgi:hypothetical protein
LHLEQNARKKTMVAEWGEQLPRLFLSHS